ncbi:MAG TPA: dihydrofolate reductase family protein [Candidatus Limnocylindrales bacterium]|jgi:dihydrofolate reductase|nr:dihydrofolate reductase family protein [Candidatus Limnocylindrales bacterium]
MRLVYANMSMSLDGFIAGPNVRVGNGMGDNGDDLHDWIFAGKSEAEVQAFMHEQFASVGAVLMGRRLFDVGIEPWGDEPAFRSPVFVVTHRPADPIAKDGGTTYTFVTDGPSEAFRLALEAARDNDIRIEGGAATVREYLKLGVVDELRLHVVPILLGGGTRLFSDAEDRSIHMAATGDVDKGGVAHLRLRIQRDQGPTA